MLNRYELKPTDGRKSFYGKAIIKIDKGEETLYSYNTPIIKRSREGKLIPLYTGKKFSLTTSRHTKAFCGINKKEYTKLLKEYNMCWD